MSRYRFVKPEVARLPLSDGDWIEVKKELTYAELTQWGNAGVKRHLLADGGAGADVDPVITATERLAIRIVDWSFRGADDKPVLVTRNSISNLNADTVLEINVALSTFDATEATEKKAMNGEHKPGVG